MSAKKWLIATASLGILSLAAIIPACSCGKEGETEVAPQPGNAANKINAGISGWIGDVYDNVGAFSPELDRAYYDRHNMNWFHVAHAWMVPYLEADIYNTRQAVQENGKRARIWYEAYWWGNHSKWCDPVNKQGFGRNPIHPNVLKKLKEKGIEPGGDDLRGKDWIAAADDPAVMAGIKKTIKWQLDTIIKHCGKDAIYGIMLSEEEPVHGADEASGKDGVLVKYYRQHKEEVLPKLIKVHNELYDYVKSNYPYWKVSPGFYSDWVKPGTLKMDAVVMDCYPQPGGEEAFIDKWIAAYGEVPADEHYIILWGYGDNDRRMEIDRFNKITHGFMKRGYRNLGFFFPGQALYDPIHRLIDTEGTGTYAPYSLEKHRKDVRYLLDETMATAEGLKSLAGFKLPSLPNASESDWSSRSSLIGLTDRIYAFREAVLEEAYQKVLKMKELRRIPAFVEIVKAEGMLDAGFNVDAGISQTQLRKWEDGLSKSYRTAGDYFKTVDPYERKFLDLAQRAGDAINANMDKTQAAYGKAVGDLIKPSLLKISMALKGGDVETAEREFDSAYSTLSERGLSKSAMLEMTFKNLHNKPLNVSVTVTAVFPDGRKGEVYSGFPCLSQNELERIKMRLPEVPSSLTVSTGKWAGTLNVVAFSVSKSGKALKPAIVESKQMENLAEWLSGASPHFVFAPWGGKASFSLKFQ